MRRAGPDRDRDLAALAAALAGGTRPTEAVTGYARENGITTRQAWRDLRTVRRRTATATAQGERSWPTNTTTTG